MRVFATLALLLFLALAVFIGVKIVPRQSPRAAGPPLPPSPLPTMVSTKPVATNSTATNLADGFFLGKGTDRTYVQYSTADPVLQSFMQNVMDGSSDAKAKGREIFLKICAACHQPDGNGKDGLAPPLVGSEWVLAPTGARIARIVLNGLKGPVHVAGKDYNIPAGMPPLRANLNDEQIAVVLSYVRSHLSTNHAGLVPSELIAAARKETNSPETIEFLLRIPDQ